MIRHLSDDLLRAEFRAGRRPIMLGDYVLTFGNMRQARDTLSWRVRAGNMLLMDPYWQVRGRPPATQHPTWEPWPVSDADPAGMSNEMIAKECAAIDSALEAVCQLMINEGRGNWRQRDIERATEGGDGLAAWDVTLNMRRRILFREGNVRLGRGAGQLIDPQLLVYTHGARYRRQK